MGIGKERHQGRSCSQINLTECPSFGDALATAPPRRACTATATLAAFSVAGHAVALLTLVALLAMALRALAVARQAMAKFTARRIDRDTLVAGVMAVRLRLPERGLRLGNLGPWPTVIKSRASI